MVVGIVKHPLFSNSALMIIGANTANVIAYLYHLLIGRLLGPESYSELASVLSIIGIMSAAYSFVGLVIVKFVAAGDETERPALLKWFITKALFFGLAVGMLFVLFNPLLSTFLQVEYKTTILIGPLFAITILTFVYRSVLQGQLKFREMVFITNLEMFFRLFFSAIFIWLGFSVFGTVVGIVIAALIGQLSSKWALRDVLSQKPHKEFVPNKRMFLYAAPVFLVSLSTNSFFSTDLLMTKHFFDSYSAGIYSSLSAMGKIILFSAGPISTVMFPMITKRIAKGQNYKKIFLLSLVLALTICSGILFFYSAFPVLALKVLFGNKYLSAAPYLPWYGLFMALFTVSTLITNFYLSLDKKFVSIFPFVTAGIQIIGIWFFHSTLFEVIYVSITASSLLLLSLIIYSMYEFKSSFR